MSNITALLTGVCMYPAVGYPALPLCANDVQAVKKALIAGLNVSESSIMVCGHHGTATTKDLITGLYSSISGTDNEDTFIFYFSGHGGKNVLALSDGNLNLQSLIDVIEKIPAKNKIIILDSCHSGYFAISDVLQRGFAIQRCGVNKVIVAPVHRAACGLQAVIGFKPIVPHFITTLDLID